MRIGNTPVVCTIDDVENKEHHFHSAETYMSEERLEPMAVVFTQHKKYEYMPILRQGSE